MQDDQMTMCSCSDGWNRSYVGLRPDLLEYIRGDGNVVLDVGCATGENGRYLLENGLASKVVGVEKDKSMSDKAGNVLTNVIVGTIESDAAIAATKKEGPYDYILLGDVLEHLLEPTQVLRSLSGLLSASGKIVMSLPNVQHFDVFLHVFVKGYWPRNERGIFDKTHLRWFTLRNIYEMVDDAGLHVIELKRKYRYRDQQGSRFPFYGEILKSWFKNYYTFQYVLVCQTLEKPSS